MEAATEKFGSDRALRAKQVSEKVGLCVSAIWAKTSPKNARYDATFPKPFKVAANATVWLESELDAWLSAKAESRIDGKQGARRHFGRMRRHRNGCCGAVCIRCADVGLRFGAWAEIVGFARLGKGTCHYCR